MLPPPGFEAAIATIAHDVPVAANEAVAVSAALPIPTPAESLASIVSAAGAAISATATASPSGPFPSGPENSGECQLLGSFALLVQLALGALALLSLVWKRWRERPQRPIKIWFFDVSKQVFGSALVHVANVFMSILTSGRLTIKADPSTVASGRMLLKRDDVDSYIPNPCSFYLLNLAIDTTLGIPILIVLLRICTGLVAFTRWGNPPESIQSGNYGNPPNAWWWLKQSVIYFCGLFGMKVCVLIIFVLFPWISRVGDWALGWTEGNEKLQIIFVMMLFPLIMNALQYYIIDSFIKKQVTDHERIPGEDPDALGSRSYDDRAFSVGVDDLDSDSEDEEVALQKTRHTVSDDEYAASGSSRSNESNSRVVPPDLYPKA